MASARLHRPLIAAEFSRQIDPLRGAFGFGHSPGQTRTWENQFKTLVVGGRPDESAGRQHVDVVAIQVDEPSHDPQIVAGLPRSKSMAGDAEGLRRVIFKIAVPARSYRQIHTEAIPKFSHPPCLNVPLEEFVWQIHARGLIHQHAAEAGCDQQWRLHGGGGEAQRDRIFQPRQP